MYSTTCDIMSYDDFRSFLRDVVSDVKAQGTGFSYRNFSKAAGFSSPNFLILLMKGERNLSQKAAGQISKAFSLDGFRSQFFANLVMYNQAKASEDKILYAEELVKLRINQSSHQLKDFQFEYYSHWRNVVIKELLTMRPYLTAEEIAEALVPANTLEEVQGSLNTLEKLGLIKKDRNRWVSGTPQITTGDKFISSAVIQFHKNMINLGQESLDRFVREERDITSVTTGISKENFDRVRQKIKDLRLEILSMSEQDQCNEFVVQVNFQMFPITKKV